MGFSSPGARQRALVLGVCAAVGACDRVTKVAAERLLAPRPPIRLWHDTVRLEFVENAGAFLGLGGGLPGGVRTAALTIGTGLLLIGLAVMLLRRPHEPRGTRVAWALILAGGLANLYDRVARDGLVVDFMNVGFGSLRTGIFNVADMAITGGALWLLIAGTVRRSPPSSAEQAPAPGP